MQAFFNTPPDVKTPKSSLYEVACLVHAITSCLWVTSMVLCTMHPDRLPSLVTLQFFQVT